MKKNDNKSFFSPVLLGMYLGAIASICADRYVTKKKEVEMQNYLMEHCYTHGGRSFISSLEDYNFSLNELYIVKYGRQYYLTNQNLKKLGSEEVFEIVEDHLLAGKNNKILSCDIIAFSTIFYEDVSSITLESAYDYIDLYTLEKPLAFPESFENISYDFSLNPCEIGMEYASSMKDEDVLKTYSLDEIYVVYNKENLYLCVETRPNHFSLLYDTKDLAYNSIAFDVDYKGSPNDILPDQINKLSNLLFPLGINVTLDREFSVMEAYQLLDTSLHILEKPFIPFQLGSNENFTSAQIRESSKSLQQGLSYLDSYHLDYYVNPMNYKTKNIVLVHLNTNQYIFTNQMKYDSESDYYIISPIQTSYNKLEPIYVRKDEVLGVMRVEELLIKMKKDYSDNLEAMQYYTVLSDYLIKYGDPFKDYDFSSKLNTCEDVIECFNQSGMVRKREN